MTDMNVVFEQLKELTSLTGVSGCEQEVVQYLKGKFSSIADEVFLDAFGNLSVFRKGDEKGPRFMITAHSDEVGGVITSITKSGFLGLCPVGVIDPRVLPGTRVMVDQKIIGTVVCIPGHTSTNQNEFAANLYIDVGAESDSQINEWGIAVGSIASFVSPLTRLAQDHRVMGKAIDNRVGCVILLQLFEQLKDRKISGEFYGVITVQEEIGMMGARMISNRIDPDFAIILDTVPLDDTPLNSMPDVPIHLGGGPVIQLRTGKNNLFLGTVAHQNVTNLLLQSSKDLNLPIQQIAAYGKWVTDGDAIHQSQNGIPVSFLSIPRRYGHTPNEVIDLNDVLNTIEILKHLVEKKANKFNSGFLR